MEKLIVIEGKDKYQYNDIKSLIKVFVNKNFFDMSKEEQLKELEKKAVANIIQKNIKIVNLEKNIDNYDENAFVIYDEMTYFLSLLKFDRIVLLEKTDANIFGKFMNKDWIQENYIIINKFADEILKKYLGEKNNGSFNH